MIDHGIIAVYADNDQEMFDEISSAMEEIKSNPDGLSTVFFSRYKSYSILTEVVYIIKIENTIVILEYPSAFNMHLDTKMEPVRADWEPADHFSSLVYGTDNITLIDVLPDLKGNMFYVYSFNEIEQVNSVKRFIKNKLDLIDHIHVPTDFFLEISGDYLQISKEYFWNKLLEVRQSGSIYPGFDSNPFSYMYYNQGENI